MTSLLSGKRDEIFRIRLGVMEYDEESRIFRVVSHRVISLSRAARLQRGLNQRSVLIASLYADRNSS